MAKTQPWASFSLPEKGMVHLLHRHWHLGEDCGFRGRRVVSLANHRWQVQGQTLTGFTGGCGIEVVAGVAGGVHERAEFGDGQWYLAQLDNGCGLENAAFLGLQIQENPGGTSIAAGLVVFQQPEIELYQRLVVASRNRLAELELELEYGIEKSKVDSVRSRFWR
jgi:hypothetical protein